jgi:hypothetical protein
MMSLRKCRNVQSLRLLIGCIAAVVVCACSSASGGGMPFALPGYTRQVPHGQATVDGNLLYVVNRYDEEVKGNGKKGTVTVYTHDSDRASATINYLISPTDLALDRSGTLYVSSDPYHSPGSVQIYGSNHELIRSIEAGMHGPVALALDHHGNLAVANIPFVGQDFINIFASGGSSPKSCCHIEVDKPVAMVFDSHDNLYVAGGRVRFLGPTHGVYVFAAGTATETRKYKTRDGSPQSLALDPKTGKLAVSWTDQHGGFINVYVANSTEVAYTIPNTGFVPSLVFDQSGSLYVGSASGVRVYPPGGSSPVSSVAVSDLRSIVLDPRGVLYVRRSHLVSVYVLRDKTWSLQRDITEGIRNPAAIAIGPG